MTDRLIGWHDMDEATYHADPCPTPSLSATCAKLVIGKTLLHAWHTHPRNPKAEPFTPTLAMQMGKAVHAAVFGGAAIAVIEADSFRTKDAKQERDQAIAEGLIPMLAKDLPQIEAMADICRERFKNLYGGPYHAERVAIWKCPRTGGWRRAMLDTSAITAPIIVDLKTTGADIDDESCNRRIFNDGLHIQAAAYEEAMETLNPEWAGRVRFYFQWQEQNAPYAMSRPFEMDEAGMELGRQQWRAAGALWDAATQRGQYPGHPIEPTYASPPLYALTNWETQKATNPLISGVV
jgi:hypothetical protein